MNTVENCIFYIKIFAVSLNSVLHTYTYTRLKFEDKLDKL